jgi:hypothetical protein
MPQNTAMRDIMRWLTTSGMDCDCFPVLLAFGCLSAESDSKATLAWGSGGFLGVFLRFVAGSKGKRLRGGSEDIFYL